MGRVQADRVAGVAWAGGWASAVALVVAFLASSVVTVLVFEWAERA